MLLGIAVFLFISFIYILYLLYFKEYRDLLGNYNTLMKVLDTRDLILLRILPELKDKREQKEITKLIKSRISSEKSSINEMVEADVNINKKLKIVYEEINKNKNPIVKEEFRRIIKLEKSLKIIRREFNSTVEEYNQNILDHKFVCAKLLRMRPVNSYRLGNE